MKLRDWVEERERRETGGMPQSASFHSKGYHRYFEGYSEEAYVDEKGKKRIRRVYTGVLHRAQISDARLGWTKRTYFLFLVLAALVFVFAATRRVGSNTCWYAAVFEALCVLGFLWLFYELVCYAAAARDMTADDFRSVAGLQKAARFKGACEGLSGAAALLCLIATAVQGKTVDISGEIFCALLFFGAAALTLLIPYLESKITYTSFLSKNDPLLEGNQIES